MDEKDEGAVYDDYRMRMDDLTNDEVAKMKGKMRMNNSKPFPTAAMYIPSKNAIVIVTDGGVETFPVPMPTNGEVETATMSKEDVERWTMACMNEIKNWQKGDLR